jgi:carbonic anhydrase
MPGIDELMRRNQLFAQQAGAIEISPMPAQGLFIVTCLDPRVEPSEILGVGLGDALVLRNAGGRITDAAIADIALISRLGETFGAEGDPLEVAIVHHTQCGTGFLADAGFRTYFAQRTGFDEADLAAQAVIDPTATVRHDVQKLLTSPLATSAITVSGHVLELETGIVSTIVPATAPQSAGELSR